MASKKALKKQPQEKQDTPHRPKRTYWVVLIIGLLVFIVLATGSLYFVPPSRSIKVLSALRAPVAIVDGSFLSAAEFNTKHQTARKAKGGAEVPQDQLRILYESLIEEHKARAIAHRLQIEVSEAEVAQELEFYIQDSFDGNRESFKKTLQERFGMTENEFSSFVLRPALLETDLKLWFYSQSSLHVGAYSKVEKIQSALVAGRDFNELARIYNTDSATEVTQGDTGYVSKRLLLPEVLTHTNTLKIGETSVMISRQGIHVAKVLGRKNAGTSEEQVRIQHIFLESSSFEDWYAKEKTKVSSWELLRF